MLQFEIILFLPESYNQHMYSKFDVSQRVLAKLLVD